jgi:hypothetical protein
MAFSYDEDNRSTYVLRDGSLLDRTIYPRLWQFVDKINTAGSTGVISEATWAANKQYFTTGTTASNFRVPDDKSTGLTGINPMLIY